MYAEKPLSQGYWNRLEKLRRGYTFLFALCSSVFLLLLDGSRGMAAAISTLMILVVVSLFWDMKRTTIFWITAVCIAGVHSLLIFFIPWPHKNYPAIAIMPLALMDFFSVYACFQMAERIHRYHSNMNR